MTLNVWVVRRPLMDGGREVVSAWTDVYDAKYEAQRWTQDFKEEWDYVPAKLILEEGVGDSTAARVG